MPIDGTKVIAALEDLKAGLVQAQAQALRTSIKEAAAHAKRTTLFKDRTKATRESIAAQFISNSAGKIFAKGMAVFLENGTKAHRIEAGKRKGSKGRGRWRNGKLAFVSKSGEMMFRSSVNHPGTTPRPFMHEAAVAGEAALIHNLDMFASYAIAAFNRA